MSKVKSQKSKVRFLRFKIILISCVNLNVKSQKTEVKSQKSKVKRQKTEVKRLRTNPLPSWMEEIDVVTRKELTANFDWKRKWKNQLVSWIFFFFGKCFFWTFFLNIFFSSSYASVKGNLLQITIYPGWTNGPKRARPFLHPSPSSSWCWGSPGTSLLFLSWGNRALASASLDDNSSQISRSRTLGARQTWSSWSWPSCSVESGSLEMVCVSSMVCWPFYSPLRLCGRWVLSVLIATLGLWSRNITRLFLPRKPLC